jgi:hypothetical protein
MMPNYGKSSQQRAGLRLRASDAAGAANLAPVGERQKVISLHMLLTNKKRPQTRDAARLGDVLLPWFEKTVARPAAKLGIVAELWQEQVPAKILQRCRLVGFERGTLTVALDSATVRAELEAKLRSGLLRVLQTGSRGALFRVKTYVDADSGRR